MEFQVTIDQFEGPLDLMLHLISEKKLDIMDLDISVLTAQYLDYLNAMEALHLEVVSEYLSELATLMEIKSKVLLPHDEIEIDDQYQEDPRARLVARLLEYQQYKEVASTMNELYYNRSLKYGKPLSECIDQWIEENDTTTLVRGNVEDLVKAMNRVLRRLSLSKPLEVKYAAKELSTQERTLQIKARLSALPSTFSFDMLCDDCHEVAQVIVTFLSVLDMARLHELVFNVDEHHQIWFKKGSAWYE